ncbi:MAG: hypothetical protein JO153_06630, partial [Solirubrobacterales bacterium]|nr:hypothetical protein [Solirubrobacterales bacterium]
VLVDRVDSIAAPDRVLAEVKDFSLLDEQVRIGRAQQRAAMPPPSSREAEADVNEAEVEEFRAVAPPVLTFASGRRR